MKLRKIPSIKEFERLQIENPAEFNRLYLETMQYLDKVSTQLGVIAIIIACISFAFSLSRLFIR